MKKVWEETWALDFDYGDQVRNEDGDWVLTAETFKGSATKDEEARACLAAAAPEMARVLLDVQYGGRTGYDGEIPCCPVCWGIEPRSVRIPERKRIELTKCGHKETVIEPARFETQGGHESDCALVAVLKKAGVLP